MRQLANVKYVNGYVDAYDTFGIMLTHQRCDKLVGYGPEGFVVMRNNCYCVHKSNGVLAQPPMLAFQFEKKKWDMHDSYLRVMC